MNTTHYELKVFFFNCENLDLSHGYVPREWIKQTLITIMIHK